MGIAEIENRIVAEARAEAEIIKKSADQEVAGVEAETGTKIELLRRQVLEEAKNIAEAEKKAILVPARLAAKKRLLEEKHKLLKEVFAGLPPETRENKEIEVVKFLYG